MEIKITYDREDINSSKIKMTDGVSEAEELIVLAHEISRVVGDEQFEDELLGLIMDRMYELKGRKGGYLWITKKLSVK